MALSSWSDQGFEYGILIVAVSSWSDQADWREHCVWTNAAISLTMVKYGGVKSNFGDWKLGMKYGEAWWYRASWVYWCSLGRAALRDLGGFWPWRLERKLLMENDPLWPKWVDQSSRNGYAGSHLYCQCSLGHKLSPILKKIPLPLPMVSFRFCARLPEVNIDEVYCMYYYECCFIIGQGPI